MSLQYDRLYVDGRCYGWSQAQGRVLEQGVMDYNCVYFDLLLSFVLEQGVMYIVCVYVNSLFA